MYHDYNEQKELSNEETALSMIDNVDKVNPIFGVPTFSFIRNFFYFIHSFYFPC